MSRKKATCEAQSAEGFGSSLSCLVLLAGQPFPEHVAHNWKFLVLVAFLLEDPHQNLPLLGKIVLIVSQK